MLQPPPTEVLEAAQRLLALKRARESFLGFVQLIHPDWQLPGYQLALIRILDRFEKGTLRHGNIAALLEDPTIPDAVLDLDPSALCNNLLVTMPPRHSKSTTCTEMFPAYAMGRDPGRFVMTCSYNSTLAADFGRAVRNLTQERDVRIAFPELELAKDSQAADVWRTTQKGAYFGIGLGATTTGRPANILITDDPIKSRADAESESNRNKTWSYYTGSLRTRLEPDKRGRPPKQIVILTRWHVDDMAGRLMSSPNWKTEGWGHVNMPALREVDGQKVALWPERFSIEALETTRALNPYDFEALYQQRPYVVGGNLLKLDWWRRYTPDQKPEHFNAVIIAADTAFKAKESNDYSVIVVAGLAATGDIYILDVQRGRWEFPDLRRRLYSVGALWRGKGLRAIYIEDKASGQSMIQELRRESGLSVVAHKVAHDKQLRAQLAAPIIEGGRVYLPEQAHWLEPFEAECSQFPNAPNDDQVDALVIALDVLSRMSISPALDQWSYNPTEPLTANAMASLARQFEDRLTGSWKGNTPATRERPPTWKGWGE